MNDESYNKTDDGETYNEATNEMEMLIMYPTKYCWPIKS